MTTPARAQEADAVTVAYQLALAQMGVESVAESLSMWQDYPSNATPDQAQTWIRRFVGMLISRRQVSREMAVSYYRLARALRTGYTLPRPGDEEIPERVPLSELRQEFASHLPEGAQNGTQEGRVRVDRDGDTDEGDAAYVEALAEILEEEAEALAAAEREAEIVLEALGPRGLDKRLELVDTGKPGTEVDAERTTARRASGARVAAATSRMVMNGARSTVYNAAERDKRAKGWVRYSMTGTPCGFCAMLLSREIAYKSESSAQNRGNEQDMDLYHDNCNCIAVEIFTDEQYASPLYDLNRKYAAEWGPVTKGLGGTLALNAWRTHIRKQQAASSARSRPAVA